jgi:hypothetical protein
MERIEIYTSKKKSFLLLVGSIIFVVGGIYFILNSETIAMNSFRNRSPSFIKSIGITSVLFFGLGIFVSIKQLMKNQLMLIIDRKGININPKKSLVEFIEWKYIESFNEIKIYNTKLITINVTNPEYWIEKENNSIRKKLMEYNTEKFYSPFNLSANSMNVNHNELMKILNQNLNKYVC